MNRLLNILRISLTAVAVLLFCQFSSVNSVSADTLGERHTFFVNQTYDATGQSSVQATLEYVGIHSYFYVEDSYLNSLNHSERALFNQQIIASAATKRLAYEKIDKLGIAQHEVLIEYVPKKNEIVIF